MSSVVPFVVSSLGRFGASAGELLMRIAKHALSEDRRAAGRWLSKWRNRITETLMRGAPWQLIRQTQRLANGAWMLQSFQTAVEGSLRRCLSEFAAVLLLPGMRPDDC